MHKSERYEGEGCRRLAFPLESPHVEEVSYLQQLADAIRHTHSVEAKHLETVPVREMFRGQVAWEGEVEVFSVEHPSGATHCYGWGYPSDRDPTRREYVCVLGISPVDSPVDAVRAAIRALHQASKKSI
jgi:hypothetical protein